MEIYEKLWNIFNGYLFDNNEDQIFHHMINQ